jgi:hypothetical protein
MLRTRHLAAGLIAGLGACLIPTDTCACTPPLPAAIVFGDVRTSAGDPVADVLVTVRASPAPCTAGAEGSPFTAQTMTGTSGRYRTLTHERTAGVICVHVRATIGEGSIAATATVQSRADGRENFLDSVRVNLQLP